MKNFASFLGELGSKCVEFVVCLFSICFVWACQDLARLKLHFDSAICSKKCKTLSSISFLHLIL